MAKFQFRERIPIDVPHTLMQLLSRFQSVKDGLPELIKNSKDQYSRVGTMDRANRTIVVVIDMSERSIAVIDFAGASVDQFNKWERWSDPTANTKEIAVDIEGGHGNGGKAFMVLGSTTDSSFESCIRGRRTKMGYDNETPGAKFKPGIAIEDGRPVEDQRLDSVGKQFEKSLSAIGVKFSQLPKSAQENFDRQQAFTIAQVNGVKDWSRAREETLRRAIAEIPNAVETHPQAAQTLESCNVWFVVDGQVIGDEPASIKNPEPFPGFVDLSPIPIPDKLPDPQSGESISTGPRDESKVLILRTSVKSLRTEEMRPLHVIRIRNSRNVVGLWSVAALCPGASSGFVFGEIKVPELEGEHLAGADRKSLNDTPLVRALEKWTSERIKELSESIQQATAKEHRSEDRDKVNESLKKLRDLMRQFLSDRNRGDQGAGPGSKGDRGDGTPKPRPRRGETVNIIELEGSATSIAIALGATVPLRVRTFEQAHDGELLPVPSVVIVPRVSDPAMLQVDKQFQVTGELAGSALVWFETEDGTVKSNKVSIELVACTGAVISGIPDRLLLQGEHLSLKIIYTSATGSRDDLLHDAAVDEIGMGRVSRNGTFVAGAQEGIATIRVKWGANEIDNCSATARIGAERVPPRPRKGGDLGGEIPLILLCGTPVPGYDHFPADQRTIAPSEYHPTIIEFDPAFENVIFINPDSRESMQTRKGRGGRKPIAGIATEIYYQFIALKCFEILKRLWVFEQAREAPLTEVQFRERFATAELECAPFIEDAYEIAEAIAEAGNRVSQ